MNIPKLDQYDEVDFVHGMTIDKLKKTILRLWLGMDAIANEYEEAMPSVTESIDSLKDTLRNGGKFIPINAPPRIKYFKSGKTLVQYDNRTGKATAYAKGYGTSIVEEIENFTDVLKQFPSIEQEQY